MRERKLKTEADKHLRLKISNNRHYEYCMNEYRNITEY